MKSEVTPIVACIGGEGKFGTWFESVLGTAGIEVKSVDVATSYTLDDALEEADVLIIALPLHLMATMLQDITTRLTAQQLVVEIASVKQEVGPLLQQLPCASIALHPMFAPMGGAEQGGTITASVIKESSLSQWFLDVLAGLPYKVVPLPLEKHDEVMAVVQGLTHFVALCIARTLTEAGIDIPTTRAMMSPVYRIQLDLVGRILNQDMELYRSIAMGNLHNPALLETFLSVAEKLSTTIAHQNKQEYEQCFEESRVYFGELAKVCWSESNELIGQMRKSLS